MEDLGGGYVHCLRFGYVSAVMILAYSLNCLIFIECLFNSHYSLVAKHKSMPDFYISFINCWCWRGNSLIQVFNTYSKYDLWRTNIYFWHYIPCFKFYWWKLQTNTKCIPVLTQLSGLYSRLGRKKKSCMGVVGALNNFKSFNR